MHNLSEKYGESFYEVKIHEIELIDQIYHKLVNIKKKERINTIYINFYLHF